VQWWLKLLKVLLYPVCSCYSVVWQQDKDDGMALVADVFYDNGTEFIQFTNGKEMLLETDGMALGVGTRLDYTTIELRRRSPLQTSLKGLP
jgi:hypothetical protein